MNSRTHSKRVHLQVWAPNMKHVQNTRRFLEYFAEQIYIWQKKKIALQIMKSRGIFHQRLRKKIKFTIS